MVQSRVSRQLSGHRISIGLLGGKRGADWVTPPEAGRTFVEQEALKGQKEYKRKDCFLILSFFLKIERVCGSCSWWALPRRGCPASRASVGECGLGLPWAGGETWTPASLMRRWGAASGLMLKARPVLSPCTHPVFLVPGVLPSLRWGGGAEGARGMAPGLNRGGYQTLSNRTRTSGFLPASLHLFC